MLRSIIFCLLFTCFLGCKKNVNDYFHKAQALLEDGKPVKAIRYLEKGVSEDSSQPYKNPKARLQLAKLYLKYDPKNINLSNLLKEAGSENVYEAYALLSDLYAQGKILENNPELAFRFIQNAAQGGDPNYLFILGKYLFDGFGVSRNFEMAHNYFEESAERGHLEASSYVCELNTLKKYNALNHKLAITHCEIAAKAKLPRAIHAVHVNKIPTDHNSVLALINNASNQWVPSHLELVKALLKGNFQNYRADLFALFQSSLVNNNKEFRKDVIQLKALYYRYWQRYPAEADKKLAINYLNQAREAQNIMAMTDWAILNFDKQQKTAIKILKLAAKKKQPEALAVLGNLLMSGGSQLQRDESKALLYLDSACSSGLISSCYDLGVLLSESYEIPRDPQKAVKHLSFAAINNHKNALIKVLKLIKRKPSLTTPVMLKKLTKLSQKYSSEIIQGQKSAKSPWEELLDRSKMVNEPNEKSKLLNLSRKSLLRELDNSFELNFQQHIIEQEFLRLQMILNPFETFDQMQKLWNLLEISKATKKLKNFFIYKGVKINWKNNIKRLERIDQTLQLHYQLQAMRIYDESYDFWTQNFVIMDDYFTALMNFRRAVKQNIGPSVEKLQIKLSKQRAELALRMASIDHEMGKMKASSYWIDRAKKDKHPLTKLVEGRMLVSAEIDQRNDDLAWQLLMDAAVKNPHVNLKNSLPLPGGKAESLILLSKMIANQRSPRRFWGKKYEYAFLKAASHFQPEYKHLLTSLSEKIDPRLALKAEKLANSLIQNKLK